MVEIRTLTLSELLNSYNQRDARPFLCHSVKAILAEKNGFSDWNELFIPDVEERLFEQLRAHSPHLFSDFDFAEHLGVTTLDQWLNWGYVCIPAEFEGMWRYSADGSGNGVILRNISFRKALISYMITHEGDRILNF